MGQLCVQSRFSYGADAMMKKMWIGLGTTVLALGTVVYFALQRWDGSNAAKRGDLLALMPPDASAVLFADFEELRHTPFIAGLYAWAPKPQADADYAQFLAETGFDYERDLRRLAIAVVKQGQDSPLFAVVDGRFDRQKISAYAAKTGTVAGGAGRDIYTVPLSGTAKKISFAFLSEHRMALTDGSDPGILLSTKKQSGDASEWRSRFERLAGSPVFAVIRQDAAAGTALAAQAPGGLRSPQLSALLDQLQWITLAGKPENDRLRVVAEGECTADATARQLSDLLNGVLVLAQTGLNDSKTRKQLDPEVREAYLDLDKNTDVSKIDRSDSKSVRLVFEITPAFLEAAHKAAPAVPDSAQSKPLLRKTPSTRKGHI